jgi:uncharacterized repeat protein (TIGR03803 family)
MTTRVHSTSLSAAMTLAAIFAIPPLAAGQQVEFHVLHAFKEGTGESQAPLFVENGWVYGTTTRGGRGGGVIFVHKPELPAGFGVSILHEFDPAVDGAAPLGALVEGPDGALYGTTSTGGAAGGLGTIYKVTPSGVFTVLHRFRDGDGAPSAGLTMAADGNFYGTTPLGGLGSRATIFRITPAGVFTSIRSLSTSTGAAEPMRHALVRGADEHLYGFIGTTVYRLALDGTFTTVGEIAGKNLPSVTSLLQASDGHLYGIWRGLFFRPQTFFRLTLDGVQTDLHTTSELDGLQPWSGLYEDADGGLYGTFASGGTESAGTAFRFSTSGTFVGLHSFTPQQGHPRSGLVKHPNGLFYGTTFDGVNTLGMLYSMTAAGQLVARHLFLDVDGDDALAAPVIGADGALYGTTAGGGVFGLGIVYRIAPGGNLSVLHTFRGADGSFPVGGLIRARDGQLYGTTVLGGASDRGTVFRISPTGQFSTLHSFSAAEGSHVYAGVIEAQDGTFWGTTAGGGVIGFGTIFKMTRTGEVTTMHQFVAGFAGGGRFPTAPLVELTPGAFYGTAFDAVDVGNARGGTVFKITQDGTFSTLHMEADQFSGRMYGGFIRGSDGALYGGTCCSAGESTIFRVAGDVFAPLHSFDGTYTRLTQDADGAYYGGTPDTIFRFEPAGGVVPLKTLTLAEGTGISGLRAVGPGLFVGTTFAGGPYERGVVFVLRITPGASPTR